MSAIKKAASICLIIILTMPLIKAEQDPPTGFLSGFNREIPIELFAGLEVPVGVNGEAVLECYRGVKLSEIYYFNSGVTLYYRDNGIEIDDDNGQLTIGLTEVRCKPREDRALLTYGDHSYRGYFKAQFENSPKGILLINLVDIEDYVKGVLPGEIGDRTPEEYEAVKAQAVAARTYAVWKLTNQETSGKLSPTIADQLYTGADTEKDLLVKGVEDTQGELITYKGQAIAAYYHAVCGGHTAPIEKIWPEKHHMGYLEGVDDKDFCAWAKSYSWSENFSITQLKGALEKYFVDKGKCPDGGFGPIRNLEFTRDKATGRIEVMRVTTATGVYKETDDHIRWALGRPSVPGAILPSTRFTAEKKMEGDKIVGLKITGTGNGHGVGMCQCGAIGQSRQGHKYHDILKYYYKHIKIVKAY